LRYQVFSLSETFWLRHRFAEICQDSLQASLRLVTNSTYGLILLHLPPPHKPGIYLPEQHRFTLWMKSKVRGYFNNLELADHELGVLRQAMETSGEWDKTWVILSADHSWRESKLYDGQRDHRVPFLVKPPEAIDSTPYSRQFNTVLTHDLILAILHGVVTNQQNVALWLNAHGSPAGTITGGRQD
jgi:membrane-anchored protein YejM (alkaline phosphatase superfamily)